MTVQITKEHLAFVEEVKQAFESNPKFHTFRNEDETLIALRMGEDRDCIDVYELGRNVANFVQQIEPMNFHERDVHEFGKLMSGRLSESDGGWKLAHWSNMLTNLMIRSRDLDEVLKNPMSDKRVISNICADIANYALMIANNEGKTL